MSLNVSDHWKTNMAKNWYQVFEETCEKYPEHEAIIWKNVRIKYGDYYQKVNKIANGLYSLGVRPGDHVAIWMTNRPEWCFVRFALHKIGAVMIPLNTRYKVEELEFVLRDSDARMLIMEANFFDSIPALEMLYEIVPEMKRLKSGHLRVEKFPFLRTVVTVGSSKHTGCFGFEDLLALGEEYTGGTIAVQLWSNNLSHIIYTSGTTGFPKGVMTPHSNYLALCTIAAELQYVESGGRYLTSLPFFGNISLCSQSMCIIRGATLIVHDKFSVEEFMETIEKEKVKHTILVPTMLIDILEHPDLDKYDLSSLEDAVVGGSVLPSKVVREAKAKIGLKIANAYGLCEASGISTWVPLEDTPEHIEKTIGLPMPHCEVSIRDIQTDEELPVNTEGEICSKEVVPGSQHMLGYYKRHELTKEIIKNGWLHSGDLGRKRDDGYFELTGRVKEMFIVGGFNVSPPEIEQYLMSHPKVENVAVVGVPDHRLGEIGAAFIRLRRGQIADEDEIMSYCKEKLANIKVPKYVFFIEEFPLNPQGKVQKFKLRDTAISDLIP